MVKLHQLKNNVPKLIELSEKQQLSLHKYLKGELLDNVYGHTLAEIIGLDKNWELDTWDNYTNNKGYIYLSFSNSEQKLCNFYTLDTHK